ncbi:hypothetical protein BD770DRAFT_412237 [Pilaira anomala]|nr:hypothetical protein BD770DRAFT_412237 [Pilaira anomala]
MKAMQAGFTQGLAVSSYICDIYKYLILHFEGYRRILTWNLLIKKKKSSEVVANQLGLHVLYLMGALYWAKMARKNGNVPSCEIVGSFNFSVSGVNNDYKEAMIWFKKSISLGGTLGFFHMA